MSLNVGDYAKVIKKSAFFDMNEYGKIIGLGYTKDNVLLKTKTKQYFISINGIMKITPKENPEYFL